MEFVVIYIEVENENAAIALEKQLERFDKTEWAEIPTRTDLISIDIVRQNQ